MTDHSELNKDIGKLAARTKGLEVKLNAFEKYQHERNHDIINMLQADQARNLKYQIKLEGKIDALDQKIDAHNNNEETGIRRIGSIIILGLGSAVVGLVGYIWHNGTGQGG
jgi:peptidoglycan hydrolase CwlO-like protein